MVKNYITHQQIEFLAKKIKQTKRQKKSAKKTLNAIRVRDLSKAIKNLNIQKTNKIRIKINTNSQQNNNTNIIQSKQTLFQGCYVFTAKSINCIIKFLQTYCSLIIPNDEHESGITIINRARFIVFGVICVAGVLILRLLFLLSCDIYKHKMYNYKKTSVFKRVFIVDRNGEILTSSIPVYDLYLQPSRMSDYVANIEKINKIIPNSVKNPQLLIERMSQRKNKNRIVFVKSGLSSKQKQDLTDAEIEGLFFEKNEKRFYTHNSANSVTGYCPSIDNCVSGIEKGMNSYLRVKENEPLKLSIDITVQDILHNILEKKMLETQSQGAVGLVMKIKTGEIISAVSLPDCDYNDYNSCTNDALFNRYSYGVYELGSVMKLISTALALQSGVSPYKQYLREAYKIDDRFTIHDLDQKESKGGFINLIEMLKISSNVGFAKLMEDIKISDQIAFLSNLGFLKRLDIELPETGMPIFPKKWTFTNAVTVSYGHGLAITPLHFVSAIASLLNNQPVRPTFLQTDDKEMYNYHYLDYDKHETFKDIMRDVISSGGGKSAYIDKYDVGGKTGTAIQYENGKYNKYSMVLAFVTAVPMYNPQYVFFLMLDRPKTDASNNFYNRASTLLGKTMNTAMSFVGPILKIPLIND